MLKFLSKLDIVFSLVQNPCIQLLNNPSVFTFFSFVRKSKKGAIFTNRIKFDGQEKFQNVNVVLRKS